MQTFFCSLKVANWLISEKFELQSNPITKSLKPKEIYLFGKIQDSDESAMDGFSFQLRIGGIEKQEHEALLGKEHVYAGINLPTNEIEKLENQLLLGSVKLSFNISLQFKQNISLFDLPKNKKCALSYFCKNVSSKNT
ncbi:MAG: hypothetical protein Ctma_0998 [Catillopecten margaritatus gill symbiont]|uniref:Uncharacterized protein n=1 Tax=Catillopecten margaritatus gill symbiont TaxID=3083288 RepID=A0AAU6PGX5_9GAMM